jgi:hypothetical protein
VRTFLESPYFKDTLLLSLVFLNDLITKVRPSVSLWVHTGGHTSFFWGGGVKRRVQDGPSKLKFFKGLASVLPRFSQRLIKEKVLAALLAELVRPPSTSVTRCPTSPLCRDPPPPLMQPCGAGPERG